MAPFPEAGRLWRRSVQALWPHQALLTGGRLRPPQVSDNRSTNQHPGKGQSGASEQHSYKTGAGPIAQQCAILSADPRSYLLEIIHGTAG
jgi:hypothetical protein